MRSGAGVVVWVVVLGACTLDRAGVAGAPFDATLEEDAGAIDAIVVDSGVPDDSPLGPLVSGMGFFSRPSVATYVQDDGTLRTVEPHVARERTTRGFALRLIEGAATNLILHSQSQTTGWVASPAVVAEDEAVAPDGSMSADRVIATTFGPYQQITANEGPLTLSLWVRAPSSSPLRARYSWDRSGFGEGVRIAATADSSWVRFSDSTLPTSAPTENAGLDGRAGVPTSGDPAISQDVWVWGWQLEAGEFASSYVASGEGRGTRAADEWLFDVGSISPQFALAAAVVRVAPEWASSERMREAWIFTVGSEADGIRWRNSGLFEVVIGGATIVAAGPVTFEPGEVVEIRYDPSGGQLAVRVAGAPVVASTGAAWRWPAAPLRIGAANVPGTELNGWVSAPSAD